MQIPIQLVTCGNQWLPFDGEDTYRGKPVILHFQDADGEKREFLGIQEDKIIRNSSVSGVELSIPLQFSQNDTVLYSPNCCLDVAIFSPWDLPFMSTGRGALKAFSQLNFFSDSAEFPESATPHNASISSDNHAIYIPAGWFFQARSVRIETLISKICIVEFEPNKKCSLRPTLMYLRGTSEEYCDLIRRKRLRGDIIQKENLRAEFVSDQHIQIQPIATPVALSTHSHCAWPCRGTALDLDLTDDWFSHNLRNWVPMFRRLGWFCEFDCCLRNVRDDAVDIIDSAADSCQSSVTETVSDGYGPVPLNALELGCWEGSSACWMLAHLLRHPASRLTCIDTFHGGREHQHRSDLHLIESRRATLGHLADLDLELPKDSIHYIAFICSKLASYKQTCPARSTGNLMGTFSKPLACSVRGRILSMVVFLCSSSHDAGTIERACRFNMP
jgi:hypothetical protein